MSESSKGALANLELSRELYTEDQRREFYTQFQAALNGASMTYHDLDAHWRSNPVKWKFWRQPPTAWKQVEEQLMERYSRACLARNQLKTEHPLLVEVFNYKSQPLS